MINTIDTFDYLNCPIFYKDFYKVSHVDQYPEGTTQIFSNFTPRKSLVPGINKSVFFGLQYFIKEYLENRFQRFFFKVPKAEIMRAYKSFMKTTLGVTGDFKHIEALHDAQHLPINIYALPELSQVPEKVPALVIFNEEPFYWLTNMLETIMSAVLWPMCTSATIAHEYRRILDQYCAETSDNPGFVDYQAHDFSFRGLEGLEGAMMSGAAHLQYFKGTDTIPAILFLNKYYGREMNCGTSVPATEHSVMCAGGKENECGTYLRLINETYPNGIVSIVSDTWDLWNVVDTILPFFKPDIMRRNGTVVIRPDSGDPEKILCGNPDGKTETEKKGLIERLYEIFGGTINTKGYKQLDPHIGAIYGDSITLQRCEAILKRLKEKGFASTNVVFGIGSYTYQYNTRDTFGWAFKSTWAKINGVGVNIFKDPITDSGIKKSHKGLLKVIQDKNGEYRVVENITWDEFHSSDNKLLRVY